MNERVPVLDESLTNDNYCNRIFRFAHPHSSDTSIDGTWTDSS